MGVEEDYIAAAFAAVEARHGGLDAYLADVIGVDAVAVEGLRLAYLE